MPHWEWQRRFDQLYVASLAGFAFVARLVLTDLNRFHPNHPQTLESWLAARRTIASRADRQSATVVATIMSIIGYALLAVDVLDALGIPATHLLVGGAVTGVVLGIAAQATLANFFAWLVLLMVRPLRLARKPSSAQALGKLATKECSAR